MKPDYCALRRPLHRVRRRRLRTWRPLASITQTDRQERGERDRWTPRSTRESSQQRATAALAALQTPHGGCQGEPHLPATARLGSGGTARPPAPRACCSPYRQRLCPPPVCQPSSPFPGTVMRHRDDSDLHRAKRPTGLLLPLSPEQRCPSAPAPSSAPACWSRFTAEPSPRVHRTLHSSEFSPVSGTCPCWLFGPVLRGGGGQGP